MIIAWLTWLLLAAAISAGGWVWFHKSREPIAPLPIFLTTVALYVLPRPAYLLWFNRAPLTSGGLLLEDQHLLIATTLVVYLVGVGAFLIGHSRSSAATIAGHISFSLPEPHKKRAYFVSVVAMVVGGAALFDVLTSVGGPAYALRHQYEMSNLLGGKQPLLQLTRLLILPIALMLVRRSPNSPQSSRPLVWLFAIVVAIALFPLGRRSLVVLALAYPVALYHLEVRPIPIRWLVLGVLATAPVISSLSYLRGFGSSHLNQAASVFRQHPASAMHFAFNATGELKVFDATTIVVRDVPDEMDYTAGRTFARVPFMVIPRRLWANKPVTLGEVIVARNLPHLQTGYPPSAVGEFYAAAGPFAVVLGCFCLGWVARLGWEWSRRHQGVGNASVYLAFCFFIFDFTRVGDPSRTIWGLIIGATSLTLAFCTSAGTGTPAPAARQ